MRGCGVCIYIILLAIISYAKGGYNWDKSGIYKLHYFAFFHFCYLTNKAKLWIFLLYFYAASSVYGFSPLAAYVVHNFFVYFFEYLLNNFNCFIISIP